MSNQKLHVLIAGGGIGGLCLANGLKKAGVNFTVFERDEAKLARTQGFRIHISPRGTRALKHCLSEPVFELFTKSCGEMQQGFSMNTEQLGVLMSLAAGSAGESIDVVNRHWSASRTTLRKVLLCELGDIVQFGKRFASYESLADKIRVTFEDGTDVVGDILVGADGVKSRVRKLYLPASDPINTGILAIGGKVPLTDGSLAIMPAALLDGPVMIMPPQACSLFLGLWKRSESSRPFVEAQRLGLARDDEAAEWDDGETENYLVMGFGAHRDFFGVNPETGLANADELMPILRRTVANWHPNLRKLTEMLRPESLSVAQIHTSVKPEPWTPTAVTLLGDAIHSMTPYRGIGANVALRDAELLSQKISGADAGELPLIQAISEYEAEMRDYAFTAVATSLQTMHRAVDPRNLGFGLTKAMMRFANSVPSIRQQIVARAASD